MFRPVAVVLFLSTLALAAHAGSRFKRETTADDINKAAEDAGQEIEGFFKTFWGARCVSDNACMAAPYISYCNKEVGIAAQAPGGVGGFLANAGLSDGECRPSIWVWIVLAVLAMLLLGTCICCCICSCCSCLLDVLCCCCRNKGYSPASTG